MSTEKLISPAQCRAARALLDWSQKDLSIRCQIAGSTVAHFERGTKNLHPNHISAMRAAFETAGIEFIDENGGGDGVRFREPTRK